MTVLFAHERPSVARAATHVLQAWGFEVESVADGDAAARALEQRRYDALVVDVALPRRPGYELVELARCGGATRGAQVVVLVASVFRKTSYKRRPERLYGADDYVELHHLGDMLPEKLARHLGRPAVPAPRAEARANAVVQAEGDARLGRESPRELAALIVADVVLYNGDRIAQTRSLGEARAALRDDLSVAADLLRHVHDGREYEAIASVEAAFTALMHTMGRREVDA